jgi:NAD(P)-dependent dehydrogenase (short-subunit alcohol dehydrogenase family)
MQLSGKIVIITGAKGGLGNLVTKAFLEAGATVIGVSRSIADADFPSEHFAAISAELAKADAVAKVIADVVTKYQRIDALVHLVGGFAGGQPVSETSDSTFDQMVDMNLRSAFYLMRAVLPQMRAQGGGRILAVGSKAAVEPTPMAGLYAASKAALVSLVRTAARENVDKAITANIVLPGTMDTPANRAAMPAADPSKWVQPAQVASLLVHLASDEAAQISGAAIPVFGAEA